MEQEVKRLFLSIKPDSEHVQSIHNFMEYNDKSGARWVKNENLHITCLFLGDVKADRLSALQMKVGRVVSEIKPFVLRAEKFTFMPASRPRMIWMRFDKSKEFAMLALLLSKELLGTTPDQPPRAHITLSRFKRAPKAHFLFSKLPDTALPVSEICLIESVLKPEGAEYHELKRWKLKA